MNYLPDYFCLSVIILIVVFILAVLNKPIAPSREKMLVDTLKHLRGAVYDRIQSAQIDTPAYCEAKADEAYLDAKIKELER